ncbi:MAG TPA: hypothetical protein QF611_14860, partial [Pseudomonadales bacterium]|nr:hypothetical protein [Pseudomonadales bacterium]
MVADPDLPAVWSDSEGHGINTNVDPRHNGPTAPVDHIQGVCRGIGDIDKVTADKYRFGMGTKETGVADFRADARIRRVRCIAAITGSRVAVNVVRYLIRIR